MLIGEVVSHVWATKKEPGLNGFKLMVVRELTPDYLPTERTCVAADIVGAGIGERVLVVSGSTARRACGGGQESPVDAAIVGILDEMEG